MSEIKIINHNNDDSNESKNFSKGYLTIPFEGEDFKEFIVGLLGKPQTISKRITGNFELHLKDLQNFFDLVHQRVTQQNRGKLIQFTAKIFFNDQSSVQLNSYEELVTNNEIKPIISEAVKLTWDYLIQFTDKKVPEKQVIELAIISASEVPTFEINDLPPFLLKRKGEFRINIEHTARSWGADIENMLSNQINSLLKKESKAKVFIRKYSSNIGFAFGALFLLSSIVAAYQTTNRFIHSELNKVKIFTEIKSHTVDEKLNFLTSYIASGVMPLHYFKVGVFLLVSIILSIVFAIIIDTASSNNSEPSFIILTRKAKENSEKIKEKMKRKLFWFFASILISISTGLISNYIFKIIIN